MKNFEIWDGGCLDIMKELSLDIITWYDVIVPCEIYQKKDFFVVLFKLCLIAIALILWKLQRGESVPHPPPGPRRSKKAQSE